MSTVGVIDFEPPYYTILVKFADQSFGQIIVSANTGVALQTQLQDYADEYEQQYTMLVNNLV
jgi:hypothetical protein